MATHQHFKIGILGGGPSALFIYKRLVDADLPNMEITIFEKRSRLGEGMPYSMEGANDEHITNVSGNEIPEIVTSIADWINTVPKDTLDKFHIDASRFNEYKTLPRLLFGQYLTAQFKMLEKIAKDKGIQTNILFNTEVADIIDDKETKITTVIANDQEKHDFDAIVICTGHLWPKKHEGKTPGYFDSPYPPVKLGFKADHPIAVRGSSLTAVDAIRTLGRYNGDFAKDKNGKLTYTVKTDTPNFKIVMHSRNGLLPALRFHLEDSHFGKNTVLTAEEIKSVRATNDGFLPLDYVFDKNFRQGIKENDREFYERIKDFTLEDFVNDVMELREKLDPFQLLAAEYAEAEKSIKRRVSIYWKEMLGVLSFAMNYPAKYFSAEDMLRLQKVLMPLISVVIAYVPQSSAAEMLAMHEAGVLDIVAVGDDNEVEPVETGGIIYHYSIDGQEKHEAFETFVDCIGQPHLSFEELPFPGLINNKTVSRARLYFRDQNYGKTLHDKGNEKVKTDSDGKYFLNVPGITINDSFQAVDEYNAFNDRIYIMAVPFIGGFNPDYSGLDFGEAASALVIKSLTEVFNAPK